MTGVAEQFLYSNGVAAINTTANGGYSLYSSRLKSPLLDAENYIPGYGYGILSYGSIDAAMDAEQTEAYKWFYHDQFDATGDEGNFNYLNSNSATVNELYGYISSSYLAISSLQYSICSFIEVIINLSSSFNFFKKNCSFLEKVLPHFSI